jgi:hypothetical protein
MKMTHSEDRTHLIRTPRATTADRTRERAGDPLTNMLSAIRDYAASRLDPEVSHVCDVALGGNIEALAEVKRAIHSIDLMIVFPVSAGIPEPVGTWGEDGIRLAGAAGSRR